MIMDIRTEILESSGRIETDKIINDIRTQLKVPNLNEIEEQRCKWHTHTHTRPRTCIEHVEDHIVMELVMKCKSRGRRGLGR
jgi:hypothetical protein